MKIQWLQILVIIFAMHYLSACERDTMNENNRLLRSKIEDISAEIRKVKSELFDSNSKLSDLKYETSRFHVDMNIHNLKVQKKML